MRMPGPMTREEFDDALDLALEGRVITDQGATNEVRAALDEIAQSAPNPPAALIEAARRAFRATQ